MIEEILEDILEQVIESPSNMVKVPCEEQKATYVQNKITAQIRAAAIESFKLYEPGDNLYGRGLYSNIVTHYSEGHLYIINKVEQTPRDPVILLCAAAATQRPIKVTAPSPELARKYAARVINSRRSLWRAVRRVVPDVNILKLLDNVSISHSGSTVVIGVGDTVIFSGAKTVPPEDAAAILAAIAERESLSGQPLDNGADVD